MGSPPIPDRGVVPRGRSPAAGSASRIPGRSPPRPHPGIRPAAAPSAVTFTPPKRRTGGSIKGKERALGDVDTDDDDDERPTARDDDFPPQVKPTYRHVLGQGNGGAANPLRVVAHVDIDAAYAAMEMARLSIPADQPMAVQQWNGLIAVNYPARAYGITRHEAPAEALKKCPHIRLVHCQTYKNGETEPGYWDDPKPETHKISLDMYRKESRKILAVFSEFCPVVEKASIDESFLDLTLPVRQLLLERYPSLSALPAGATLDEPLPAPADLGITRDSVPWDDLCNLVPFAGQKQDKIKRLDAEGAPVPASSSSPVKSSTLAGCGDGGEDGDDGEPPLSWSDIALSLGALLVGDIRNAVRARLGYTCSAGIATNKMLAKLTSAWKKPNAQTVLRHCAVPAFLRPMGFQKIRNLGGKLGNAVKETYEAETVGDLLRFSLPELKAKLGDSSGTWLWEIVRGLDYTEVDTKTQVKSMISSKNFRPSVSKYGEVMHWLNILATELHLRLLDARAESPGLWPKTITFTHRSPSFVIRSHQAPFPFTSSLSIAYILRAADKLLRAALSSSSAPTPAHGNAPPLSSESAVGPYSNMMLSFSGLERLEDGQRGIEGFFAAQQARGTTGGAAGARASSVGAATGGEGRVKREVEEREDEDGRAEKRRRTAAKGKALEGKGSSTTTVRSREATIEVLPDGSEALVLSSSEDDDARPSTPPRRVKRPRVPTYTCARCARVLSVPDGVAERGAEDEVREALEREKAEHADWHVARDLVETERKESGWTLGGTASRSSASSLGSKGKTAKGSSSSTSSASKEASTSKRSKQKDKKRDGAGTLNGFLRRG